MSDQSLSFDELSTIAGNEITRLRRLSGFDARTELQLRVWPFLEQLTAALADEDDERDDDDVTTPVAPVAQAIGLIFGLVQHLGQSVTPDEAREIARRAAEISDSLIALVDADELAAHVAAMMADAQPASTLAAPAPLEAATPASTEAPQPVEPAQPASATEASNG